MPHKYNADRRHHIPRACYKVTNWSVYEAGLRQRGSLTIWFSEGAVAAWQAAPRTTSGGQLGSRHRDVVDPASGFPPAAAADRGTGRLAARVDGAGSAGAGSLHLEPTIQDAGGGASGGKRTGAPAGRQYRREAQRAGRMAGREAWHPAPPGLEEAAPCCGRETGTIVASTLTSKEVDDAAELGPLLDQIDEPLAAVIADGAYDQDRVYDAVAEHSAEAAVVVPPRATAVLSPSAETDPTHATAIFRSLPSRVGWAGSEPRATMRGPEPRGR